MAPAASAAAAVPSREPSSATTTSASGNAARSAATVAADPLLLVAGGDEDGDRLTTRRGSDRLDRREDAVGLDAVVAPLRRPASSRASAIRPSGVSTCSRSRSRRTRGAR